MIFETEDGVQIVGDYLEAVKGAPMALLLHMMPRTRLSWHPFMVKLSEAGFNSLAIDFRGHGDSTKKFEARSTKSETLDYKKFSDAEQQAKILDVRAAVEWLEGGGASKNKLIIVGASIGANLALQYMTQDPEVRRGVLLSPGFDYRGIKTDLLIKKLASNQHILLIASRDDEYSFKTVKELNHLVPKNSELWEFSNLGHGTTMFEKQPKLMDEVIDWLDN